MSLAERNISCKPLLVRLADLSKLSDSWMRICIKRDNSASESIKIGASFQKNQRFELSRLKAVNRKTIDIQGFQKMVRTPTRTADLIDVNKAF